MSRHRLAMTLRVTLLVIDDAVFRSNVPLING